MPRPKASDVTEARVTRLVQVVLAPVIEDRLTVAALAREANLQHETVRRLLLNPSGKPRYGPGFFIISALARAQDLSLDYVAQRAEGS